MADLERCCDCDEPTGRAGRADDSLYWSDEGPFCPACYNERSDTERIYLAVKTQPALLAACKDMLSGWRYIRETHGDLYGVGWDRAQTAAESAIAAAEAQP